MTDKEKIEKLLGALRIAWSGLNDEYNFAQVKIVISDKRVARIGQVFKHVRAVLDEFDGPEPGP